MKVLCPTCKGRGWIPTPYRVDSSATMFCQTCGGSGWAEVQDLEVFSRNKREGWDVKEEEMSHDGIDRPELANALSKPLIPYCREYIIIMYQVKGKVDKSLEKDLDRVIKKHKFKFIGSGYDTTNKRIDMEYRRGERE